MEPQYKIPSLSELRQLRKPIRNVKTEFESDLSPGERFAVWVTKHVGSTGFFAIIITWTLFWFTWNILAPRELRFDPFPEFAIWLFTANIIQLFMMPLLMIGQNLDNKRSDKKAEHEFEINLKTEREVEAILQHLEKQDLLLTKISEKLNK